MMKIGLLLVLLAANSVNTPAQDYQFSLSEYYNDFRQIQKKGMKVLGSWAVLNFAANGIPLLVSPANVSSSQMYNFLLMNVGWNVVNAGLAGFGLFGAKALTEVKISSVISNQYRTEKIFLFNAGLDVGYVGIGLYLIARSATSARAGQLGGFGYSLLLQGTALFVFDVAMQLIHAFHRKKLDAYLNLL